MTEESSDLKINPDAAEDLSEEPSALPASEDGYGLSGKALRDYLSTMQIACDAPGKTSGETSGIASGKTTPTTEAAAKVPFLGT